MIRVQHFMQLRIHSDAIQFKRLRNRHQQASSWARLLRIWKFQR
jgi:hypothetical protein